jgi:ribosomal protein L13
MVNFPLACLISFNFVMGMHMQVIQKAVNGMLPKNNLRKKRMRRLHLFPDDVST